MRHCHAAVVCLMLLDADAADVQIAELRVAAGRKVRHPIDASPSASHFAEVFGASRPAFARLRIDARSTNDFFVLRLGSLLLPRALGDFGCHSVMPRGI